MERPRLRISEREFMDLPEYSCSIPTGQTPGKRWKKLTGFSDPRTALPKHHPEYFQRYWIIGEYGEVSADEKTIAINWYKPVIILGCK